MSFDPSTFQGEVMRWNSKNFPLNFRHQGLVGAYDEVGKLLEALARIEAEPEHGEEYLPYIRDAVGNTMTYLALFSAMNGFTLIEHAVKQSGKYSPMFWRYEQAKEELPLLLGRLSNRFLLDEYGIRMQEKHKDKIMEEVGGLVGLLTIIAESFGLDLAEVTEEAWDKQKVLDWKQFPKDGAQSPNADTPRLSTPEAVRKLLPAGKWAFRTIPSVRKETEAKLKPKPSDDGLIEGLPF